MASILQVEQIKGPTSGANANKITIPSGQTLDASNATLTGLLAPDGDGSSLTGITTQTVAYWQPSADSTMNTTDSNYITNWTEVLKSGLTMSHSSGTFTFPETGLYKIECHFSLVAASTDHRWVGCYIEDVDQNNIVGGDNSFKYITSSTYGTVMVQALRNITDTSLNSQKYKFNLRKTSSNDMLVRANSTLIFTRLGDSV